MRCNLCILMGKARFTIEDVHRKTGLSRLTVKNLYHDSSKRVDYRTIEKLCSLFDCRIDELFTVEGCPNEKL